MILFILAMILCVPFVLTFSAYALTNGFEHTESTFIDDNETLELVEINNSLQLCFDNCI